MMELERELAAAREGAIVWSRPDQGTLLVSGPDRQSWLNGLVTCDLSKLSPGGGAYGLSVNKAGKIQAELVIVIADDRILVGVEAPRAAELASGFDRYLIMEDAEISAPNDLAWVWVLGPHGRELAAPLAADLGGASAAFGRAGLVVTALAVGVDRRSELESALRARLGGAPELSERGWKQLRIEQGIAQMGVDFGEDNYPQEAGLERDAVSFDKGCYLGQETVFMLEKRGHVKKRIVQLEIDGADELAPETPIAGPDAATIGSVTSSVPRLAGGGAVALGWVKYKFARAGTSLEVGGHPARVTEVLEIRPAG